MILFSISENFKQCIFGKIICSEITYIVSIYLLTRVSSILEGILYLSFPIYNIMIFLHNGVPLISIQSSPSSALASSCEGIIKNHLVLPPIFLYFFNKLLRFSDLSP